MKCEACGKEQKELNADCLFGEWMCDDCYCKYDWHSEPEKAIEKHEKNFYQVGWNK